MDKTVCSEVRLDQKISSGVSNTVNPPEYQSEEPPPYVHTSVATPPEFLELLSFDVITCPACSQLLQEPCMTGCGHTICRGCIAINCPVCLHSSPSHIPNRVIARLMVTRPVRCLYCPETTSITSINEHLTSCNQRPIKCPNCNHRCQRNQLAQHSESCEGASVQCPDCKHRCLRSQLPQHSALCGGAWIECKLCNVELKRRNLCKHTHSCQLRRAQKRLEDKATYHKIRTFGLVRQRFLEYPFETKLTEHTKEDLLLCVTEAILQTQGDYGHSLRLFQSVKFKDLIEVVSHASTMECGASKFLGMLRTKMKRSKNVDVRQKADHDITLLSKYRTNMNDVVWSAVHVFVTKWCRNQDQG